MKMYIYKIETKEIVDTVTGETNKDCEENADALNYNLEDYAWSYTNNELI